LILRIENEESEGIVVESGRKDCAVRRDGRHAARRSCECDVHETVNTASAHERRGSQQV
jgi:hypothetical protein